MFTASTIHGPAGLKGLDGLAILGSLAMLPTAFTTPFGRATRSHSAPPRGRARPASPAPAAPDQGAAATAARLLARVLAWLAQAAERRGQQWARAREQRLTAQALGRLDRATLRDIGLTHSEIGSMAAEAAGLVERTRARAWSEIGCRVV